MAINTFDVVIKYTPDELKLYLDALETEARLVKRILYAPRPSRAMPSFDKIRIYPTEALKEEPATASKVLQAFLNGKATNRIYSSKEVDNMIRHCVSYGMINIGLAVTMTTEQIEATKLNEKYFIVEPA